MCLRHRHRPECLYIQPPRHPRSAPPRSTREARSSAGCFQFHQHLDFIASARAPWHRRRPGTARPCTFVAPALRECSVKGAFVRFEKKMGHYVYLSRCNIMFIVFLSETFFFFAYSLFLVCLRFVGASCAPAPRRPHGGQCLRGARAGRAPLPRSVALRAPWRPPCVRPAPPLRHRPPFPRHPRGPSAPRKRASPALSGVPLGVFGYICQGVPLGVSGTNLGCE